MNPTNPAAAAVCLCVWSAMPSYIARLQADEPQTSAETVDVLIVAPHSDDEALGCTGVVLRAIAAGRRVGVVVVSAGDGHVRAAAAVAGKEVGRLGPQDFVELATLRQRHTLQAMIQLGIPREQLLFLGYPDGGLKAIFESNDDAPYRQPHTRRTRTYGVAVRDYHTLVHGSAAPYVKAAVIDDLVEILKSRRPQQLFTTDEVDRHGDHQATFWFVREAARRSDYAGELFTYVVHGNNPDESPSLRLDLTDSELRKKRQTIETYQAGVSPVHDSLAEHYARPAEQFWKRATK